MEPRITAGLASKEDIDRVMFDDEIYDRISDDSCPPKEEIRLTYHEAKYVAGYIDGETASLAALHDGRVHFMVLKPYRLHAHELWKETEKYLPPKMYAAVPSLYKTLINFAKKHGFREVDVQKKVYRKNGRLYDRHILLREVTA